MPAPVLVRFPLPETAPESVRVVPVAASTVPPKLPKATALPAVRLLETCSDPPCNVTAPEPRATLAPMASVPASTATPPENVFAPARTRVPAPVLTTLPTPETTPESVSVVEASVRMFAPSGPEEMRRAVEKAAVFSRMPPLKARLSPSGPIAASELTTIDAPVSTDISEAKEHTQATKRIDSDTMPIRILTTTLSFFHTILIPRTRPTETRLCP